MYTQTSVHTLMHTHVTHTRTHTHSQGGAAGSHQAAVPVCPEVAGHKHQEGSPALGFEKQYGAAGTPAQGQGLSQQARVPQQWVSSWSGKGASGTCSCVGEVTLCVNTDAHLSTPL